MDGAPVLGGEPAEVEDLDLELRLGANIARAMVTTARSRAFAGQECRCGLRR